MAEDPPRFSTRLLQSISTYWVLILTATLTALATALLQAKGEQTFDILVTVLGKRLLLQITVVIFCSLGYCVFLLVRKDNKKQLQHRRQLYWLSGDPLPYCPRCYDDSEKRIHLVVSLYNKEPNKEHYECHICDHDFTAWNGVDFSPHFENFRAFQKKHS